MMLWCPICLMQHIDEGEWATRSHRTHQCQGCGCEWRPSEISTVGVRMVRGGLVLAKGKDGVLTPVPEPVHFLWPIGADFQCGVKGHGEDGVTKYQTDWKLVTCLGCLKLGATAGLTTRPDEGPSYENTFPETIVQMHLDGTSRKYIPVDGVELKEMLDAVGAAGEGKHPVASGAASSEMSDELRAAYRRHSARRATDADLLAMAISEADRAMRSLPPHCLPSDGGLSHNQDHANACAHRCWSFLGELRRRLATPPPPSPDADADGETSLYVVKHSKCDLWIAERAGSMCRWGIRAEAMKMPMTWWNEVLSDDRRFLVFEIAPLTSPPSPSAVRARADGAPERMTLVLVAPKLGEDAMALDSPTWGRQFPRVDYVPADLLDAARVENVRLDAKWREYERDYVLPCFRWATDAGFDLEALVREKAGKNCVELFGERLRQDRDAARVESARLERELEVARIGAQWEGAAMRFKAERDTARQKLIEAKATYEADFYELDVECAKARKEVRSLSKQLTEARAEVVRLSTALDDIRRSDQGVTLVVDGEKGLHVRGPQEAVDALEMRIATARDEVERLKGREAEIRRKTLEEAAWAAEDSAKGLDIHAGVPLGDGARHAARRIRKLLEDGGGK